jgi:hypothetical protein
MELKEELSKIHNQHLYHIQSNIDDENIAKKKIVDFFGYDNETLFSVKLNEHNVPVQWLDNQWHYFFDRQGFIPKETKFVHAINKDFDVCWRRYYA